MIKIMIVKCLNIAPLVFGLVFILSYLLLSMNQFGHPFSTPSISNYSFEELLLSALIVFSLIALYLSAVLLSKVYQREGLNLKLKLTKKSLLALFIISIPVQLSAITL